VTTRTLTDGHGHSTPAARGRARPCAPAAPGFRAAMFDLDGTLLDTLDDLADSMNAVLERRGWPAHPRDAYRFFVGEGARLLVTRALPAERRGDAEVDAAFDEYRAEYGRRWNARSRPYDGIAEMLGALSVRGLRLAVLSNKPHAFTRKCVEHFFPGVRFDAVHGHRESTPPKPDPAAALAIARDLGVPPAAWLYLGDSGVDMETANRAGMFAAGVLWGFRPREELERHGARALCARPADALALL